MTFVQHIMPCIDAAARGIAADDHPEGREDCICVVCVDDTGRVVWHSHDDAAIDVQERLNRDVPVASDTRP